MNLHLSILDQSPVRKGGTARQALHETVQLVQLAERLGYTRYWVSEHHNTTSLAGSAPEILIARLASETNRIRLGSGGIMLPNHSTLKVAENFRLLESLFPGRIDLGIGRAPGGDRLTATLLNPSNTFSEQDFMQQLLDLDGFLTDAAEPGTVHQKVRAIPIADSVPERWMLTSSGQSALFAAHFGMAVSFAQFINPVGGPEAIAAYRQRFRPSELLPEPKASVGIFALCADTDEKAAQLRKVMDYQLVNMHRGVFEGFPSYESIKDYQFSEMERHLIERNEGRVLSGTPDAVKEQITQLANRYDVDEVMIAAITYDFRDRLRTYELLADAFQLSVQAAMAG